MTFLKSINKKPEKLFKLLYWKFFFGYLPIGLLIGLFALFDINPIIFNEEPVVGVWGFVVALLMIPFMVFAITTIVWILFMIGDIIIQLLAKIMGQ